jgi:hypothetical protein
MVAKTVGDWSGVIKFFKDSGIEVRKKTMDAQWEICKKLKSILIRHIIANDLNWANLSPITRANKKENKNMIYMDTELYINSIQVWRNGLNAQVGLKKGATYRRKSGSVSLERVAMWMEYGTQKMPARPLWAPSIEELGGKEGIRDFVVDAIFRRLKWLAKGKPIKITKRQVTKLIS